MDIKSTIYPEFPVFHNLDRTWRSDSNVTFLFLPENESDARMYIGGLIPYLRDTQDHWYLKAFTEEARGNHQSSIWDPIEKQVSSTSDVWIRHALALDDELNFTDTPTTSWQNSAQVQFDMPEVDMTGDTPALYRDQDSVSTFHPNRHTKGHHQHASVAEHDSQLNPGTDRQDQDEGIEDAVQETNYLRSDISSIRGRSVTFNPLVQGKNEDIMSRLSDNNSRISALESHFSNMSAQFSEALGEMKRQSMLQTQHQDALALILSKLLPERQVTQPIDSGPTNGPKVTEGGQHPTSSTQANPLSSTMTAGGSDGVAGHGS
jgi:hypothetical protein